MSSLEFPDSLSPSWTVVALLVWVGVAAWLATGPTDVSALYVASVALLLLYVTATAFDGVREHPAFPVVQGAFLTVLFGIAYLTNGHVVVAGFAALSGVGFLVECYNYRFGTSHLRLDA